MSLFIEVSEEGTPLAQSFREEAARVKSAAKAAGDKIADRLLQADRADISGAGNFGPRWTNSLSSKVTQGGGGNVTVTVSHNGAPNFFSVFETGAIIAGKPELWIPVGPDNQGIFARRTSRAAGKPLPRQAEG